MLLGVPTYNVYDSIIKDFAKQRYNTPYRDAYMHAT